MEYKEFLDVYHAGPEATFKLVSRILEINALLNKQVTLLSEQVPLLEERVKELEAQRNKNSRNSSKPPSSDEFIKPKSQRKKSGKKPGGQKGHKGQTLKMRETPDVTVTHRVERCQGCGHSLEDVPCEGLEKRQEFDVPMPKLIVTEHQAETKQCPCCNLDNQAPFPKGVEMPVQYGPNIKSFLVYLNQYQMVPYKRVVELVKDLYGFSISEGTLFNFIAAAYDALEPVETEIVAQLIASPVVHADETGLRIEAKRQWLHVVSTETLTHYGCHPKRGSEATDAIGILPQITGVTVHDYWRPYYKYNCEHSLCNSHHLRELTGIDELTGQEWPHEMRDLLLEIKTLVDERKGVSSELNAAEITNFEERYERIMDKGYLENPPPEPIPKKRGRKKQSKARNMLDRLRAHRPEVLAFMYDFNVPFDNNQAERDIRMMKVKQKISGVFRSAQGAKMFCRIRGYISIARKNSVPILEALKNALGGNPFIPELIIKDHS